VGGAGEGLEMEGLGGDGLGGDRLGLQGGTWGDLGDGCPFICSLEIDSFLFLSKASVPSC